MRLVHFLSIGFAAALFSQAAVIDFDTFADGVQAGVGTFDPQGVRFDQNLQIDDGDDGGLASSQPNYAYNIDTPGGNITGFFLGPVTSVSFISVFAGDVTDEMDTVTLNGYNAANVLVATDTFTAQFAQTLSISGAGMTRFEILQSGNIGIDDFTFTPELAGVPEPASFALAGIGMAAFALWRRAR